MPETFIIESIPEASFIETKLEASFSFNLRTLPLFELYCNKILH